MIARRTIRAEASAFDILEVLGDMMRGTSHSRRTVAFRWDVSLPTADRWLAALLKVPGVRMVRVGKTTWFEFEWPAGKP